VTKQEYENTHHGKKGKRRRLSMSEITFDNDCSMYADVCDTEDWTPCRCPVCKGFLPVDIFQDPLVCRKCGSELVAIPCSDKFKDSDDWNGEEGRICVVTKGTKTKQQNKEERKTNRVAKENYKKWRGWL
jgi:hypothetical protein